MTISQNQVLEISTIKILISHLYLLKGQKFFLTVIIIFGYNKNNEVIAKEKYQLFSVEPASLWSFRNFILFFLFIFFSL